MHACIHVSCICIVTVKQYNRDIKTAQLARASYLQASTVPIQTERD